MASPSNAALRRFVSVASQAAQRAGQLLARRAGRPTLVEQKRSPSDLVTEVDRASEQLIYRIVKQAFPEHGFYGEEHAGLREDAAYRWFVDPIDGTTNFVHGVPLFVVSIGLWHDSRIIAGVVYDPMRRELFAARRGGGAFLNGRRLRVSATRTLSHSMLSTGFPVEFRRQPEPYLSWFRVLESRCHAVRRLGSTALSLAYVAAGRLDGFYEQHLRPWDIAAGLLLVEEAGGRISDLAGQPAHVEDGRLVATNGHIHLELVRRLQQQLRMAAAPPKPVR